MNSWTNGKNHYHRVWAIVLIVMMILSGLFIVTTEIVAADQDGDYTFTVSEGVATIVGYTGAGGAITIPATLGGYDVVAIGNWAFANLTSLTSVVIPNGVVTIGVAAFRDCIHLTSVIIPNSVTDIGLWAFLFCEDLTSVDIPGSVTNIGPGAFMSCTSLSSVTIGNGVESIGVSAFYGCTSLNTIGIPDSVELIGELAFVFCSSLTSIDVESTNLNYASVDGVVYNKTLTTLITCPGGKTGDFTIPDCVITIEGMSFYACSSLTGVTIPSSVTTIGGQAFSQCTSMAYVTIGCGVNTIGGSAFDGSSALKSISFQGLVAPTYVGDYWIYSTNGGIRGHAHATSNFPVPGNSFHGLTMGTVLSTVPPGTPGLLSAEPSNATIDLMWSAPSNDGGSTITGYKVYRSTTIDGSYTMIGSPSVMSYTDTGLTNGLTYWYEVSAVNAIGEGARCSPISAVPVTVPTEPREMEAVAGDAVVELSWIAPSYIGAGSLTYHLFRDGLIIWSGSGLSYSDTSVSNGLTYSYKVAAQNAIGWGPNCTAILATPMSEDTVPNAPTELTATAGNAYVDLSWKKPSYTGPGTIIYHLFRDSMDVWNGTLLSHTDTSVTNGVTYSYTVAAENSIGYGPNSSAVQVTPVAADTVPSTPRALTAIASDELIELNWTAPLYEGPGTLTYHLFRDGAEVFNGIETEFDDGELVNGLTYLYSVASSNSIGWSANSSTVSATPQGPPSAPTGLTAEVGDGFISLNWSEPCYTGPGNITYHLFRNGGQLWSGSFLAYNDSAVVNDVTYNYTVVAENDLGWSDNSTAISATPVAIVLIPPSNPIGLEAESGDRKVTLTWQTPVQSGSANISGYNVYRGNSSGSLTLLATVNGTTYVDSNVTNGQVYHYKVSAFSSAGESNLSAEVEVTPDAPASGDGNDPTAMIVIIAVVAIAAIILAYLILRRRLK